MAKYFYQCQLVPTAQVKMIDSPFKTLCEKEKFGLPAFSPFPQCFLAYLR